MPGQRTGFMCKSKMNLETAILQNPVRDDVSRQSVAAG